MTPVKPCVRTPALPFHPGSVASTRESQVHHRRKDVQVIPEPPCARCERQFRHTRRHMQVATPPKINVDAQEVLLVPHTHNQTHGLVSGRPVLAGSYVLQALGPHHASPPAPDAPDDGPFDDKVGSAPSTLFTVVCLVVAVGASRHYGLIPFAGHGRLAMAIARAGSAHPKPKVRPGRSRNPLGKRAVAPPEPPSPDCHRDGRVESELSSQHHDERPHPAAV